MTVSNGIETEKINNSNPDNVGKLKLSGNPCMSSHFLVWLYNTSEFKHCSIRDFISTNMKNDVVNAMIQIKKQVQEQIQIQIQIWIRIQREREDGEKKKIQKQKLIQIWMLIQIQIYIHENIDII